jgi:hypothetical protein
MDLTDQVTSQLTSLVESRAGAKTLTSLLMWRDHPETMPRTEPTQFLAGLTMLNPRFVAGFLDAWEYRHPTNPSEDEYAMGFVGGQNHTDIEEALREYKASQ